MPNSALSTVLKVADATFNVSADPRQQRRFFLILLCNSAFEQGHLDPRRNRNALIITHILFIHVVVLLQRYNSVEHAYSELTVKYKELNTSKVTLEKKMIGLQSALEEEKKARSRNADYMKELDSRCTHDEHSLSRKMTLELFMQITIYDKIG